MVDKYDTRSGINIIILNSDEEPIAYLDPDLADVVEHTNTDKCRNIELTYPLGDELITDEDKWYNQGNKVYIPATLGITSCLYVINTSYALDFWDKNNIKLEAEEVLTELNYDYLGFEYHDGTNPKATINLYVPQEDEEGNVTYFEATREETLQSGGITDITLYMEVEQHSKIYAYRDKIEINSETLQTLFGEYYDITGLDALDTSKKYITPKGTMSYMSLLRLIEEQTDRAFTTHYINNDNKIIRRMELKNTSLLRQVAQTETLDLNYNLESLELEVTEENTYNAMAPEFTESSTTTASNVNTQSQNNVTPVNAELQTKANNPLANDLNPTIQVNGDYNAEIQALKDLLVSQGVLTQSILAGDGEETPNEETPSNSTVTTNKTLNEVIQDWLNYEVEYRQEVPMIMSKDDNGDLVATAYWYAPFQKQKGNLFIQNVRNTQMKYHTIHTYKHSADRPAEKLKLGKVSTSETVPQLIYNTLSNSLLNKLSPKFTLKIEVKDIQQLLGLSNLSYNVNEILHVRIPNFDYYVPCRITETTKNVHLPGENSIKVETDVKSMYNLRETAIESNDMIIQGDEKADIGGILLSEDEGLPDQLITINIKLETAFDETTTSNNLSTIQSVKPFDDVNNTYVFPHSEIVRMQDVLAKKILAGEGIRKNSRGVQARVWDEFYVNMRTVTGEVIKVPAYNARAIYHAHLQNYVVNEDFAVIDPKKGFGKAKFDETISVHDYGRNVATNMMKTHDGTTNFDFLRNFDKYKKYTYSYFLDQMEKYTDFYVSKISDSPGGFLDVGYSEKQNGPHCVPASFAELLADNLLFFERGTGRYFDEATLAKLMGTSEVTGTDVSGWLYKMTDWPKSLQVLHSNRYVVSDPNDNSILQILESLRDTFSNNVTGFSVHPPLSLWLLVKCQWLPTTLWDGIYAKATDNHQLYVCDWYYTPQDGLMFCVRDTNQPVFNPIYSVLYDGHIQGLTWVKAEYLYKALVIHFKNDNPDLQHAYRQSKTDSLALFFFYNAHHKDWGEEHEYYKDVHDLADTFETRLDVEKIDTTKQKYSFAVENVQSSINNAYKYYIDEDMKHELKTIETEIVDIYHNVFKLKVDSLRALGLALLLYYQSHEEETKKSLTVDYGGDSVALAYQSKFNTEYDYFTPCNAQYSKYANHYALASVLWEMGYLFSYADFFQNDTSDIDFNGMVKEITNKTSCMCVIRDCTNEVLQSVLRKASKQDFKNTVCLVWAKDNSLNLTGSYTASTYPLVLYSRDGSNVSYYNAGGRGNSYDYNFNTKESEAVSPYGTTSISNLISWVNNASSSKLQDKNQVLIVSRTLKLGSV